MEVHGTLNYMKKGAIFNYTPLTNYTCKIPQTCNAVFCCETSWSLTWSYTQHRVSTCNATMLRDKLKRNVASITGPLSYSTHVQDVNSAQPHPWIAVSHKTAVINGATILLGIKITSNLNLQEMVSWPNFPPLPLNNSGSI